MDELPSAEFRRRYARLTEPTNVTVSGHVIGQWIPVNWFIEAVVREHSGEPVVPHERSQTTQARRDELLRKINRR